MAQQPDNANLETLQRFMQALKEAIKKEANPRIDINHDTTWNQLLDRSKLKPTHPDGKIINRLQNKTSLDDASSRQASVLITHLCDTLDIKDLKDTDQLSSRLQEYLENNPYTPGNGGRSPGSGGCENILFGKIINEFIEQDVFHNILGQEDSWPLITQAIVQDTYTIADKKKFTRNVSSWKTSYKEGECKGIKDKKLLDAIADALDFDRNKWGDVYSVSDEDIKNRVTDYRKKLQKTIKIDIGAYKAFMTDESSAEDCLDKIEQASLDELKALFANTRCLNGLKRSSDDFLKKAFLLLYDKGAYSYIREYILPHIPSIADDPKVRYHLAHYYGSTEIGEYAKAIEILRKFPLESETNADLQTALLSNILRHALTTDPNDNALEKLFEQACDDYGNIFQRYPHYYPGINYAYMLFLGQNLFDDNKKFQDDTIEAVYKDSRDSIATEKDQKKYHSYYPVVSEYEFLALLDRLPQNDETIQNAIERTKPTADMLMRTVRQIIFADNQLTDHVNSKRLAPLERLQAILEKVTPVATN